MTELLKPHIMELLLVCTGPWDNEFTHLIIVAWRAYLLRGPPPWFPSQIWGVKTVQVWGTHALCGTQWVFHFRGHVWSRWAELSLTNLLIPLNEWLKELVVIAFLNFSKLRFLRPVWILPCIQLWVRWILAQFFLLKLFVSVFLLPCSSLWDSVNDVVILWDLV